MNLAIVGYGKMGRMLERLAPDHGCTVKLILDEHNNRQGSGLTRENFAGVDAAIEFTTPETAVANIEGLLGIGVPVVVGTTGWLKELDRIRALVSAQAGALVWSPNYSIGMNVFFRLVREAARLMADKDAYESWAWEIHHSAKKDAPSGTLLKLVEEMRAAGYPKKIDTAASRAGFVPGTHEIGFDGPADTITLRHTVRNREGFAAGALYAAKWIAGRQGFYEFSEILFNERH
ncbi:MAG: dihydrodipicolinate reductase [Bryobacter sp.]|jgi:4-hydroxy-tetrahydrodipicolinate reductase|nr:dihydrodipicolinate reductase [Bryobacter sp.]